MVDSPYQLVQDFFHQQYIFIHGWLSIVMLVFRIFGPGFFFANEMQELLNLSDGTSIRIARTPGMGDKAAFRVGSWDTYFFTTGRLEPQN